MFHVKRSVGRILGMELQPGTNRPVRWVGATVSTPDLFSTTTTNPTAICPDLLRLADIGEADGWRGHAVRGFFRLLKWVSGV